MVKLGVQIVQKMKESSGQRSDKTKSFWAMEHNKDMDIMHFEDHILDAMCFDVERE